MTDYNCIVVLGPTASGKTRFACEIAAKIKGEVISADSRQVYKDLDIGTGKDLNEYTVNGKIIPYHLISIRDPEKQYFLHEFISDSRAAFEAIRERKNIPIFCGGTGLYLDTLRKDFSLTQVPEDHLLRKELENYSKEDLIKLLDESADDKLSHTDRNSKKRIIRAIEISQYLKENGNLYQSPELPYHPFYIGIKIDPEVRKEKIRSRLVFRLQNGLIEEVKGLLEKGISQDRLLFLGLEYKWLANYLSEKISYDELVDRLSTAIIQFSKRQMTWFRKMEKEGVKIHWVEQEQRDEMIELIHSMFREPLSH